MSVLVDTNIILYSINVACQQHQKAKNYVDRLLVSGDAWCLTWVNVYEFLRTATHANFPHALSGQQAWQIMEKLLRHPRLNLLRETEQHTSILERVINEVGFPRGNFFHDCHLAAIMLEHGIQNIVTADVEFRKFPFLKITDPTK